MQGFGFNPSDDGTALPIRCLKLYDFELSVVSRTYTLLLRDIYFINRASIYEM